jgi:hypothetical protein
LIKAALAQVLQGDWHIMADKRSEDAAGMEQVRLIATIRVQEKETDGLVDRIRRTSRSGLKLHLDRVVYRPPQAAVEEAQLELRKDLYRKALMEARLLNETISDGAAEWRVGQMQIATLEEIEAQRLQGRNHNTAYSSAAAKERIQEAETGTPGQLRLFIGAKVVLKRLSLPESPGGFYGRKGHER